MINLVFIVLVGLTPINQLPNDHNIIEENSNILLSTSEETIDFKYNIDTNEVSQDEIINSNIEDMIVFLDNLIENEEFDRSFSSLVDYCNDEDSIDYRIEFISDDFLEPLSKLNSDIPGFTLNLLLSYHETDPDMTVEGMIESVDFVLNFASFNEYKSKNIALDKHILSFEQKVSILYENLNNSNLHTDEKFLIQINRKDVFADSFFQISILPLENLRMYTPQIHFIGEPGSDMGGLTKELLELVVKEALNPINSLFTYSTDQRSSFRPYIDSEVNPNHLEYFKFIGKILGLAIINKYNVGAYFDRSVMKYILDEKCDIEDLKEINPQYYDSLVILRDYPIEESYTDTFSGEVERLGKREEIDFIPNGRNIEVKDYNKKFYLEFLVEFKLFYGIKNQLNALKEGLFEIVDKNMISIFTGVELELLLCGNTEIDVEDWIAHTVYEGYDKNDRIIKWFWSVVREFSNDEKIKLLKFVSGSSRIPFGGFENLQVNDQSTKFKIVKKQESDKHFPASHTCSNTLDLPNYSNKKILKERLIYAITNCNDEFGSA